MAYEVQDYLADYNADTQGSPFSNEIKFEVVVINDCTGETIVGVVWGEYYEDVVQDVADLLTDCQFIEEIINVY